MLDRRIDGGAPRRGELDGDQSARIVAVCDDGIEVQLFGLERRMAIEVEADRRAKIVHLTGDGRKLITRAFAEHVADMERLAGDLTRDERATLIRLLKKIGYKAAAEAKRET